MVGFLGVTPAELVKVPTAAESLTAVELHSVLPALEGDTFDPGSIYVTELTTATGKMERVPDGVRVWISHARRGLSPGTPAE